MMKLRIHWLLAALLLLPSIASGQFYFGKNKVQYQPFDWKVLATQHFRIYFNDQESDLAEIAAAAAEESYDLLADKFNHHIFRKIPLIIYSAPTFFTQTNVTPTLLPESVAGFTEFFKGRMVVPFNGSIADFQRVIRHELVHVFTFDKIPAVMSQHRKLSLYGPPLWFTEGLSEFWSREWDSEADMVMADMALEGNLRPIHELEYLSGTFFMYKYGESFCHFVADNYGEDKLQVIFDNWWKAKTFRQVFKLTVDKSLEEVGAEWVYYLKKKYFPELKDSDLPAQVATPLAEKLFAVKPLPLNITYRGASDWIAYKANKLGYSGLYMRSPSTDQEVTLVKGERSPAFESLHLLQSKLSGTDDGRIVFVSKRYERDVLYVYNVFEEKITETFEFPKLYQLLSPTWSQDGKSIVFSGASARGYHDLYLFSVVDSSLRRLTDDIYFDTEAVIDLDGSIVFSSDRCSFGYAGYNNLFRLSLVDSTITPLTYGRFNDRAPFVSEEGILFSSDREGVTNTYLLKREGGLFRVSNFATGAFDPCLHDGKLVFSGYQRFGFNLFSTPLDTTNLPEVEVEIPQYTLWSPTRLSGDEEVGVVDYANEFSFDIAQSAISYDAVFGTIGGFQAVFSDMLGNQMYYVLLSNSASEKSELLESFNVGVTYINKSHRINYGIGAYHLYDEHFDDYEGYYSERQSGVQGLVSYPISKFSRVETSMFARHSFKKRPLFQDERHAILATNYASIIHDNSLWDISGPLDGIRANATVGLTTDFYSGQIFNRLAFVDLRNYLRIRKYSAFATRAFGFISSGEEPQRIYLGGSWSLRGYDRREFYARKVLLFSNELRFPLIDNLFIGFPFGPVGFQAIRGALFFDAGSAWNDEFDRFYGSFGFGARVALGYMAVLRFDFSKKTDFQKLEPGMKFDFFFGWNF